MPNIVIQNAEGEPEVWRDVNTVRFLDEDGGIVSFRHTDPKEVTDTVGSMIRNIKDGEIIVQFVDWYGVPIQTTVHDYGDSANIPDLSLLKGPVDMEFYGWTEDTDYLTKSCVIFPMFRFKDIDDRTTVFKMCYPTVDGTLSLNTNQYYVYLYIGVGDASSDAPKTINIDWGDGTTKVYTATQSTTFSFAKQYTYSADLMSKPIYIKVTSDSECMWFGNSSGIANSYWSGQTSSSYEEGCFYSYSTTSNYKYHGWQYCVAAEFGSNVKRIPKSQIGSIGRTVESALYKGKIDIIGVGGLHTYNGTPVQRLFIPKGVSKWRIAAGRTSAYCRDIGAHSTSNASYIWYIKDVDELEFVPYNSTDTGHQYLRLYDGSSYYSMYSNIDAILLKFANEVFLPASISPAYGRNMNIIASDIDNQLRIMSLCTDIRNSSGRYWGNNVIIEKLYIYLSGTSYSSGEYNISGQQGASSMYLYNLISSDTIWVKSINLGFYPDTNLPFERTITSKYLFSGLSIPYIRVDDIEDNPNLKFSNMFAYCPTLRYAYIGRVTNNMVDYMFYQSTLLERVEFGNTDGLTVLGSSMFSYSGIMEFTAPDNITTIESNCFSYTRRLQSIILPESITAIKSNAFAYSNIQDLYIKATTPPTLDTSAFYRNNGVSVVLPNGHASKGGPIIHVPADSVDAYKSASGWSSYKNLIVGDL